MKITYYISFAVCAALIGMVLRSVKSGAAQLIGIGACVMIFLKLFADHTEVIPTLRAFFDENGFSEYGATLIKALGVGILCQIGGDVCRDMGEGSVASALELAGKLEIVALALPIAAELISIARALVL